MIASGKGISLSTKSRLDKTPMSGWVWRVGRGRQMPVGLKLINDRPGHYAVCPTSNMALDEFDAGNDFIKVSGLYDQMSSNAVEVFGQQILDFSKGEI